MYVAVSVSQELASVRAEKQQVSGAGGSGGGGNQQQQLVKLKAQVKFGEDALRQEQELVKQLQEQLAQQKLPKVQTQASFACL